MPARLVDLTTRSSIRLIETAPGIAYQYACLSHRFDDALRLCELTLDKLPKYLVHISLDDLPKTFCDAICIARRLDIQYLWIDSLCIIQRGDSGVDLRGELGKMGFIYQNGLLTISAISSPNSSGGCFINEKWPDIGLIISSGTGESNLIGGRVLDKKGPPTSIEAVYEHYPLLRRGWVFQERLMSTRLLTCNYGEFAFECLESSHCECNSILSPHLGKNSKHNAQMKFTEKRRFLLLDTPPELARDAQNGWRSTAMQYWKTMIGTYMQLDLSLSSDILPAMAGCAQTLAPRLNMQYVAGMWKETLATDLIWYIIPHKAHASPRPRPQDTTAPSWSWTSVSMNQTITHFDCYSDKRWQKSQALLSSAIKEVSLCPESALNPFGKLADAHLKLEGMLYQWYLRWFCPVARTKVTGSLKKSSKALHMQRSTRSAGCTTDPPGLALQGATIDMRFDGLLGDEHLTYIEFDHCDGPDSKVCQLMPVSLLHVLHGVDPPSTLDIFIVLRQIAPVDNKPNCYRRIGMMKLIIEDGCTRSWDKLTEDSITSHQEQFWLF